MILNIASFSIANKLLKCTDNIDVSIHENVIRFIVKVTDKTTFSEIKKADERLSKQLFYTLCKSDIDYIVEKCEHIVKNNSHSQYVHPRYNIIKSTLERAFNNTESIWSLSIKDIALESTYEDTISLSGNFFLNEISDTLIDTVPFNVYAISTNETDLRPQLEKLKMMLLNSDNYNIKD